MLKASAGSVGKEFGQKSSRRMLADKPLPPIGRAGG
jgi:hypothetical protein